MHGLEPILEGELFFQQLDFTLVLLDLQLEVIDASLLGGVTDDGGAHTELVELFLIHLGAMWRPTNSSQLADVLDGDTAHHQCYLFLKSFDIFDILFFLERE